MNGRSDVGIISSWLRLWFLRGLQPIQPKGTQLQRAYSEPIFHSMTVRVTNTRIALGTIFLVGFISLTMPVNKWGVITVSYASHSPTLDVTGEWTSAVLYIP